jgi:hypothetical protein
MMLGKVLVTLILLTALTVALAVATVVVRRRRAQRITQPVCGQCGYAVEGLPSFTCPECGSDLRAVGIVTPGPARPLRPITRVILWTIMLPIPACLVSLVLLLTVIPSVESTREAQSFEPVSGAYSSIEMVGTGSVLIWPWQRGSVLRVPLERLQLSVLATKGLLGRLDIDLSTQACRFQPPGEPKAESPGAFGPAVLTSLLSAAGIDVGNAPVQAEIDEVARLVHEASAAGLYSRTPQNFRVVNKSITSNSGAPGGLLAGFWLLIWVVGVWTCIRRTPTPQPTATVETGARVA